MGDFTTKGWSEPLEKLVRHDSVLQTPVFQFQVRDRRQVGENGNKIIWYAVREVAEKGKMGKLTTRAIEQGLKGPIWKEILG